MKLHPGSAVNAAEASATLLEDPQEREAFERLVISRVARLIAGASLYRQEPEECE